MKTITKYLLQIGCNEILMPVGATILSVQATVTAAYMWVISTRHGAEETEKRTFSMYGTDGHLRDDCGVYVATIQQSSNTWHVFETTDVET